MHRKQVIYAEDSPPPKSIGARIFSSIGSLLLAAFLIFLSFLGVLALGWGLQTLFPQHQHGAKSGSSQPALPDDIQSYLDTVGKQVKASGTDLGAIVQLSADASTKPALLQTQDWQVKVARACDALGSEGKALQSIGPVPGDCAAMQKDVSQAGKRYVTIAQEFSRGADVNYPDITAIHHAVAMIDLVTQQDDKRLVADSGKIRAKYGK